jgi:hypothetical protein
VGRVSYEKVLDDASGVVLYVDFTTSGPQVLGYSLVLTLEVDESIETIRVYDGTHQFNEMHRYVRGSGKQPGVRFHAGSLGEGMRAAKEEIENGYWGMIEGWRSR